jgi:DNA processing protein
MIGSRNASRYAQDVMRRIIPDLVAHGCSIVSGGAIGADTMAHEMALDCQGKTCAILGSGLLEPYPRTNRKLFKRIVDVGGALISPFPLQTKAQPAHFPARNRIISGLSRAVVVVQAKEKSGTRITAQYALDQGREVGAVPGPIDDVLSHGCHALLKEGAHVVTSGIDVLNTCGIAAHTDGVRPVAIDDAQHEETDPLMQFCREPRMFDDIVQYMNCSYDEMQAQLFALQMAGNVQQDFTGRWVACT